jgi:NAD(P)-dependent dehydrogenase (short-subunit alcohol dehydrogenase family)
MSGVWADRFPARELLTFRADLGDSRQAQAFGARILEAWGGTDVLVNNAGLYEPGLIMNGEPEALENLMNLNLYGAYYLTRMLLPSFVCTLDRAYIQHVQYCQSDALSRVESSQYYQVCPARLLPLSERRAEVPWNQGDHSFAGQCVV